MNKTHSIIVADDDTLFTIGLKAQLREIYPDCLITEVKNGKEAVDLLVKRNYDFIFMDYLMPVMDGAEATKVIRQKKFNIRVMITSLIKDPVILKVVFDSHPDGYYLKDSHKDNLRRAVDNVLTGRHFYSDEILEIMVTNDSLFHSDVDTLSDAEWKVLMLKLGGLSPEEISAQRNTSIDTVNSQLGAIYDKLDNNPFVLTCYAVKHGRIKSLSFFTPPPGKEKITIIKNNECLSLKIQIRIIKND